MNQKSYFKYTLLLSLNLILSLLYYMIPKTKNQILLGAKNGTTFFGNTKIAIYQLTNGKANSKILSATILLCSEPMCE